jgi:hypothetical protein
MKNVDLLLLAKKHSAEISWIKVSEVTRGRLVLQFEQIQAV